MPTQLQRIQDGDWQGVLRNFDNLAQQVNPPVPQARVYNSVDISIVTSGTLQTLTFNSERWDEGSLHSTSANTGRLTASITGLWQIGASVDFASNATGYRQAGVLLNGTTFIALDGRPAISGQDTSIVLGVLYRLMAGEFVEVQVRQTSGAALNVVSAANFSPEFWMHRVSGYVNQGV